MYLLPFLDIHASFIDEDENCFISDDCYTNAVYFKNGEWASLVKLLSDHTKEDIKTETHSDHVKPQGRQLCGAKGKSFWDFQGEVLIWRSRNFLLNRFEWSIVEYPSDLLGCGGTGAGATREQG